MGLTLDIVAACKEAGVEPEDVEQTLYLYRDFNGHCRYIYKFDKTAHPEDEREAIGYATAHGSLSELKKALA